MDNSKRNIHNSGPLGMLVKNRPSEKNRHPLEEKEANLS